MSLVRIRHTITMAALMHWERIVARAAPATPIFKYATKNRSSAMLTKQLMIRKYSGRLESPTARKIPAPIL